MSPRRGPMDIGEMAITVVGVDHASARVMVRDAFANEFEIDGSLRPKGVGFPAAGERWLIERRGGSWLLDRQIGVTGTPIVDGTRTGMHPVAVQMLDALAQHGLVFDSTIGGVVLQSLDDSNDPPPVLGEEEEPLDPEEAPEDEDPGAIPPNHNGPLPDADDGGPSGGMVPIYFASFNLVRTLGNQRARQNLQRLANTRAQVIGLQEMAGNQRDSIVSAMASQGWAYYRPKGDANSDENTILWRDDEFTLLDQDWVKLSGTAAPAGKRTPPPRYYIWVRLRHKASGRVFVFISTHLLAHIEGHTNWHSPPREPGRPSRDPNLSQFMENTFDSIKQLRAFMQNQGEKWPVILVGDMNVDFFKDRQHRTPKFPFRQWREVRTFANWHLIDHRPRYGTHGKRYIDSIWVTRPKEHQVRFVDHWILIGYDSDHRPVLVKAMIRSKN